MNSDIENPEIRKQTLIAFIEKHHLPISVELLDQATTHDSYSNINSNKPANERLETLGDAVIDLLATEWLYNEYIEGSEAKITQLRAEIVENVVLGKIAKIIGLDQITLYGRGAQIHEKQLADSLEAIFGAIFFQNGYNCCKQVFGDIFNCYLEEIRKKRFEPDLKGRNQHNPKNYLQELLTQHRLPLPHVKLIDESGPPHNKKFTSQYIINLNGQEYQATGIGSTKKISEKHAATNMLKIIKPLLK